MEETQDVAQESANGAWAALAWAPGQKAFLKVQIQIWTGENLSAEDERDGFVDYVLWSTFRTVELGVDEELEMEMLDGGIVLFKEFVTRETFMAEALKGAYEQAFDEPFAEDALQVLLEETV